MPFKLGVRAPEILNILCWCRVLFCGPLVRFPIFFSMKANPGSSLLDSQLLFHMSCSDWHQLTVLASILFIVLHFLATKLPLLEYHDVSKNKSWPCAGCHKGGPPQQGKNHKCMFSKSGFTLHNHHFSPCHVWYHAHCIVSGPPFATRDRKRQILEYNPDLVLFPFVCECCTVWLS